MEDYHSAFNSDDISLLEKSVEKTLEAGCKECGFRYIVFTTNVSLASSYICWLDLTLFIIY